MKKWEYRWVFISSFTDESNLNDYGAVGWEFTGFARERAAGISYFMKREVVDEAL
jgi:hypothetical protein